jgi:amphi-Trp domain-containing protein
MKGSRQGLKVEGAVELPHVISYLEQLVTALKSGAVRVHRGEDQVVLGPRGVVGFSLAASDKGKRQKLTLELSWRKFAAPDPELDLAIGAGEEPPAAEEVAEEAAVAGTDMAAVAGAASVYTEAAEGYTSKPHDSQQPVDADGKPQGTPAGAQGYEIGGGD